MGVINEKTGKLWKEEWYELEQAIVALFHEIPAENMWMDDYSHALVYFMAFVHETMQSQLEYAKVGISEFISTSAMMISSETHGRVTNEQKEVDWTTIRWLMSTLDWIEQERGEPFIYG